MPDAGGWDLMDCWKCMGDPCLGVGEFSAANGSGVRAGWTGIWGRADGNGEGICEEGPELDVVPKRSTIDWAVACCRWGGGDWGTGMPDKPSTTRESAFFTIVLLVFLPEPLDAPPNDMLPLCP